MTMELLVTGKNEGRNTEKVKMIGQIHKSSIGDYSIKIKRLFYYYWKWGWKNERDTDFGENLETGKEI